MSIDVLSNLYGPAFCAVLLAVLVWISVVGRDRWPFSCYPMFSIKMDDRHLSVFSVALDQGEGGITRWKPEFHRLPRAFDKAFRETMSQAAKSQLEAMGKGGISTEQRALFAMIAAGLDENETRETEAIMLVRRRFQRGSSGIYSLDEIPVLRVPIAQLRHSP